MSSGVLNKVKTIKHPFLTHFPLFPKKSPLQKVVTKMIFGLYVLNYTLIFKCLEQLSIHVSTKGIL